MKKLHTLFLLSLITTSLFSQTLPAYLPADGLVGWWPFNGNANDESGNGNNGTVNGAILGSDRISSNYSCYYFNGLDAHIEVPHSSSINCQEVTISVWFKADDFIGELNQNELVSKREYSGWGNS